MSIANKLGTQYESVRASIRTKTIKININDVDFQLKVRIPLKREMESILENIQNPSKERIEELYTKYSSPVLQTIKEGGDDFLNALNEGKEKISILENDVVVDGTSMRQVATMSAMWELRVEQYFHLLQSETGEPINETYEQIVEEFPEQVIRTIMGEIDQAISPDYKTAKKN